VQGRSEENTIVVRTLLTTHVRKEELQPRCGIGCRRQDSTGRRRERGQSLYIFEGGGVVWCGGTSKADKTKPQREIPLHLKGSQIILR